MTIKATVLRRALGEVREKFIRKKNIHAIGIGEKFQNGEAIGEHAFVFLVNKKDPQAKEQIPPSIRYQGSIIATDVQVVPGSDFQTTNSSLDGSDILIASNVGRAGTLGLVVREDGGSGRTFGITNAHVVSRPNENHVGDIIEAVVNNKRQIIGEVVYQSDYKTDVLNRLDLALIELNQIGKHLAKTHVIQTFKGLVTGSSGLSFSRFGGALRQHAYGGSTQHSRDVVNCAMVSEHPETLILDNGVTPIRFSRTFIFSSVSNPVQSGHSGAVIVRSQNSGELLATGLLAAGGANSAFAFSFTDVLSELESVGFRLA